MKEYEFGVFDAVKSFCGNAVIAIWVNFEVSEIGNGAIITESTALVLWLMRRKLDAFFAS